MNWKDFEAELKKRMTYSPGDIHYAGRGYWYPFAPDITTGDPAPKPPAPWVHVEMARGETKADPEHSAFVTSSFSKAQVAEAPDEAMRVVDHALMDFDTAAGADPISLPPIPRYDPASPPAPRRGKPVSDEDYEESRRQVEREWEARHGTGLAKRARAHAERRQRGYAPEEASAAVATKSQEFKRCNNCGKSYTIQEWLILDELGTQKIEAEGDEPACTYDARNCGCGSTLFAVLPE